MKKGVSIIFAIMLCIFSLNLFAASGDQDLKETIVDLQERLDELESRVDKTEQHTFMDKINFSIELRSRVDSLSYTNMRGLPDWASSMMGLWAFNRLVVPGSDIGGTSLYMGQGSGSGYTFNPQFMQTYSNVLMGMMDGMVQMGFIDQNGFIDMNGNNTFDPQYDMPMIGRTSLGSPFFSNTFGAGDLPLYQAMFKMVQPKQYDYDNDVMYTTRLRMNMESTITDNLKFMGRMTVYKTWGNGAESGFFNGSMSSMMMDGLDVSVPSDDKIRLERAFFTYGGDNWHFSVGRRPSTDGAPTQFKNYGVIGGSPIATLINWQFDGMSLGFNLEDATGIPGSSFKLCYGYGFESGWGNSYSYTSANANVKDVDFAGFISNLYRSSKFQTTVIYAHAFNMTDGFTGTVVMPFVVQGNDINQDGAYDEYYLFANAGGYISRNQPTANIGSMDMASILFEGQTGNFGWFASASYSKTKPEGRSMNPMMQFWGKDALLNDNGGQEDHSGSAVWVGAVYNFENGARIGLEYNHGSQYWFNFTGAEDNIAGAKAAARGDVYEAYFTYPIVGSKFFLQGGYQFYDYAYTGSGNPLGAPIKIENATAFDALMPIADKVKNMYFSLTLRY